MNNLDRFFAFLLLCASLLLSGGESASVLRLHRNKLRVRWGLPDPTVLQESQVKWHGQGIRVFRVGAKYFEVQRVRDPRVAAAWLRYKSGGVEPSQAGFANFVRENDPYLSAIVAESAPKLYFEFIGVGQTQYVLTSVEVKTFVFSVYAGSGFVDANAWYDIVLAHRPGIRSYDVPSHLRFNGSGRAEFRFWSDNFEPGADGNTPLGRFVIQMTFHFLADGQEEDVSTGVFAIDA